MSLPLSNLIELLSQMDQTQPLCVEWQGARYEVVDALVWDGQVADIKIRFVPPPRIPSTMTFSEFCSEAKDAQ